MKTNTTQLPIDPIAAAERALAEAGLPFTVVEACPQPACEVCQPGDLSAAA